MDGRQVFIWKVDETGQTYPEFPYDPPQPIPELPYPSNGVNPGNTVYEAIRNLFHLMGLDAENRDTARWNPLGDLIRPGHNVVIKPNYVYHKNLGAGTLQSVLTHSSVLRPIIDYALKALNGKGSISILDAPQANADLEHILAFTKTDQLVSFYRDKTSVPVRFIDIRNLVVKASGGVVVSRKKREGDPAGSTVVDLGHLSFHAEASGQERLFGSDFDREETVVHHSNGKHEYCIANTVLQADVFINVPKMKTHRKAGITAAMKNLIGINCDKNFLPHYRVGYPGQGGDEGPDPRHSGARFIVNARNRLKDLLLSRKKTVPSLLYLCLFKIFQFIKQMVPGVRAPELSSGAWPGNRTLANTICDLENLLSYYSPDRGLNPDRRPQLHIVDGFVAGEGCGPYACDDKFCGVLMAGTDARSLDLVTASLMGFDPWKLNFLKSQLDRRTINPEEITLSSNQENLRTTAARARLFTFASPPGWESCRFDKNSDP